VGWGGKGGGAVVVVVVGGIDYDREDFFGQYQPTDYVKIYDGK